MSETIDDLRTRRDDLAERYRDLVPAVHDARERFEGAESAEAEARREARTRHALGELTDELRGEEEAITTRLDELRSEYERVEDACDGVGEKVEDTGDALADAIEEAAAQPVREIDRKIAALSAQLAAAQAERQAPAAAYAEAKREASEIRDESKVRPHTRRSVQQRRHHDNQVRRSYEQIDATRALMNSIGANRGFPRKGV